MRSMPFTIPFTPRSHPILRTAIHLASRSGHVEVLKALLEDQTPDQVHRQQQHPYPHPYPTSFSVLYFVLHMRGIVRMDRFWGFKPSPRDNLHHHPCRWNTW